MTKRLVYILNSFSSHEASHFSHVVDLLDEIARNGVDIDVVIEKARDLPRFSEKSVRVHALSNSAPVLRQVELFRLLRRLIRDGAEAVFTRIAVPAGLISVLACMGTRAQSFYWQSGTVHDFDRRAPWSPAKLKWWLGTHVPFRLLIRRVDRFVTGPESMLAYYRSEVGVPAGKLALLYNDVNLARLEADADTGRVREQVRAEHGIAADELCLLFVHRMSPVRRSRFYMPYVVERLGLKQGERVVCLLAGDGPELPGLQQEVAALQSPERYVFLGSVPNRQVQRLFQAADVFLHPTYNEGFPRVVLEAMAAGLPMVSTDAGGTADLVGPLQSKYVVPRDDRDGFVDHLSQLLSDPDERRRIAQENREHVRRYDTPVVARMYVETLFP